MKKVPFSQKGFTLLEVLLALAITGIIAAVVLSAIQTSTKILIQTNTQEIAKDIAANDMEYIRSLAYADTYTAPQPPAIYSTYVSSVNVTYLKMNEQQITISISLNGTNVFTLTDYRVNF